MGVSSASVDSERSPAFGVVASELAAETSLARRAAAGDRASQRQLFHRLKPRLHATLFRVMGSNVHVEDLLQDAFAEIFRCLASYRGDARLSTWADRIAVRVAYRHFARERARRRTSLPAPELGLVASTEDEALHREGVRRLYRVLSGMKPEHRVAFALFEVDGRSLKEIASITGVSLVAAKSRVWRAHRELARAARSDSVLSRYLSTGEG